MNRGFRRITTGVDAAAKSCITEDLWLTEAAGAIEMWRDRGKPDAVTGDGANLPYRFYPPPGESIVRIVHLPPSSASVPLADLAFAADVFFESQQIPECRIDTSRHPFMHRTPTLDYAILLTGRVALLLDLGESKVLEPMDMVVQRMTNHMWVNTGTETAALLVVMIGHAASDVKVNEDTASATTRFDPKCRV